MAKTTAIEGARDGRAVALPKGLNALVIGLEHGALYVNLAGQVSGMVLIRATVGAGDRPTPLRLILSPMNGGRVAVGVIKSG